MTKWKWALWRALPAKGFRHQRFAGFL